MIEVPDLVMAKYCRKQCLEAKRRMLGYRVDIMEESVVRFGPVAKNQRVALYLALRGHFG